MLQPAQGTPSPPETNPNLRKKKWATKVRTGCVTCRFVRLAGLTFFPSLTHPQHTTHKMRRGQALLQKVRLNRPQMRRLHVPRPPPAIGPRRAVRFVLNMG